MKKLTFDQAIKKMLHESFIADDDIRDDEIYDENLEKDIKEALLSLCDFNDCSLDESFKDEESLEKHFKIHCLNNQNKVSTSTNVYYDFDSIDKYEDTINFMDNIEPDLVISNLGSRKTIEDAIRKLSSGNCCVYFNEMCGIPDKYSTTDEVISIKINSFANDFTTNFKGGNTADFAIYNEDGYTKTQYPISLKKLMNKLNSLADEYSE